MPDVTFVTQLIPLCVLSVAPYPQAAHHHPQVAHHHHSGLIEALLQSMSVFFTRICYVNGVASYPTLQGRKLRLRFTVICLESPVHKQRWPPSPHLLALILFPAPRAHSTEVTDDNLMVTLGLEKILNLQREILFDPSAVLINGVGNL